jgi:hypothetical protein
MPSLSVFLIRLSLTFFLAGVTLGALLLADKGLAAMPWLWPWRWAHIVMSLNGWLLNLVFGTAYWILPRNVTGDDRGRPSVTILAVVLLNAGIGLSMFFPTTGLAIQFAGCALFVYQLWSRIYSMRELLLKGGGGMFPRG